MFNVNAKVVYALLCKMQYEFNQVKDKSHSKRHLVTIDVQKNLHFAQNFLGAACGSPYNIVFIWTSGV